MLGMKWAVFLPLPRAKDKPCGARLPTAKMTRRKCAGCRWVGGAVLNSRWSTRTGQTKWKHKPQNKWHPLHLGLKEMPPLKERCITWLCRFYLFGVFLPSSKTNISSMSSFEKVNVMFPLVCFADFIIEIGHYPATNINPFERLDCSLHLQF